MRNKIAAVTCSIFLKTGAALLSVMVLLPGTAFSAVTEYSIIELYNLAKAKDPALNRAGAQLESGRADKDIATAGLMPRLNAIAGRKQFWPTVENYQSSTIDGHYYGYNYGLTGGVPLLNMGAYYQMHAADSGVSGAEAGLALARQDLMIRLVDAYTRYLKASNDIALIREDMGRTNKILEQAEAFLKAGTGDVIAVYEAKARMDSAAAELVKAEGGQKIVRQRLANLTGLNIESVKNISFDEKLSLMLEPLDSWLETMRQRNPAILQARYELTTAEEMRKSANAGHFPTVSAIYGYTVDKGSTFLPDVITEQYYLGFNVNIPIYAGGETSGRVRRAMALEMENRAALDDAGDRAVNRLHEAYLNLQYNFSLYDAYRQKNESADVQLKAVQKGREIGTRTAIDLLNAEKDYAVSRRDLANIRYDILMKQVELKAAAGILDESDLADITYR